MRLPFGWSEVIKSAVRVNYHLFHFLIVPICSRSHADFQLNRRGEGMWIPMGDTRWEGLTYENHTSYPSKGEMPAYPGGIRKMEMVLTYGSVCFASKAGQLAGNHFLSITDGLIRLYALGGKCLYEGAQPITIELE